MENEDQCKRLESSFKNLDDEGKRYILGILQALEFAQSIQEVNITQSEDKEDKRKNEYLYFD